MKKERNVMYAREDRGPRARKQAGFALILAILSLMLLTFLGLTLAATTSTELQIATNYRWSQQALYNAEAGVEFGKWALRTVTPDFGTVLPSARTTPWTGLTAPSVAGGGVSAPFSRPDAWGNATRNFESWSCDNKGNGMGYGVVLDDGSASAPYQYVSTAIGQNLNGAFTLWIRRPLDFRASADLADWNANDDMVLVSEGIAPFTGTNITTAFGSASRAVSYIEVTVTRANTTLSGNCGGRSGQAGGGPLGAGFGGCDALSGGAAITAALAGQATGAGTELNPNQ
jgi:Tfp pilus assembly protein PilX